MDRMLESTFSVTGKNFNLVTTALKKEIPDYYAVTNPIIERMYSPSINEF